MSKEQYETGESFDAKIVLLGDSGVGKTCLVNQFVQETFEKSIPSTVGASFMTKRIFAEGYRLNLQIWDTAGQERFKSLTSMYYRKASVALLVYDITSQKSFDSVRLWIDELQENVQTEIIIAIVGNKVDLEDDREVSSEAAAEFAKSMDAEFCETSAKQNLGVTEIFERVCKKLVITHEVNMGIRKSDSECITIGEEKPVAKSNTCCS